MNHNRRFQIILHICLPLLTGDICPTMLPRALVNISSASCQDLQSLLRTEEHQRVLAGTVKLPESSTSSDTSCKLLSTGIDTLRCLPGLALCPELSQPGHRWDRRISASK